ncbi:Hypothetical protein R9X50_00771800 [Acrodontium crateriforme]|uniref:J domain-containing protein n=1 Tax=Acrodontium crateriforme TaxID=150365 RepID=A0AAQ3R7Z0_9PEZI|nr:Hypothetical protein R9X50_00771800 [Acrodontium crateriforme]
MSQLLSLAGWYFLPNLVTGYVQQILYAVFIRAGDPKPAPGSPRYIKDRKRVHMLVILAYLCYTIYEADYAIQQAGDFYGILGVPTNVDERALQSRFRRLTVQFHPDKVAGDDRAAVEATYVHLKLARDTLADPARRFAYDRFGPEALQWRMTKTIREFVMRGAQHTAMYYFASGTVLLFLGMLGYLEQGRYWRYLVMSTLFIVEMHVITRPDFPRLLSHVLNPALTTFNLRTPYLPFQILALLRKLTVTFFIALNQLGPLLKDGLTNPQDQKSEDGSVTHHQLDRLEAANKATHDEINRLMGLEMMPFAHDASATSNLRKALSEWLVQNTIRNDPEVMGAITQVLQRRREGGREVNSLIAS